MKILVIDDDEQFRSVLVRSFKKKGHEAFECGDPREALSTFEKLKPQYVVIDLKMPHQSGLDLIPALISANPDVKIIILTGYGSIATAQEAIKRGAHYYLTKPCDADKILAAFEPNQNEIKFREPSLAQVEWDHINRVLHDCAGNVTKTAKALGLDRRSLQRKLAKVPKII